jgi:hypothetical protein
MRIAVNTRLLLTGKLEGIGWFTFETLKRITRLNPDCEFFFLFDRPFRMNSYFRKILLRLSFRHKPGTPCYGMDGLNILYHGL